MRTSKSINGLRKIKRSVQTLCGLDCFFKPDIDIESIRFGSPYGGWNVPESILTSAATVYCAGIGFDISFDLALMDRFQVDVHAFDPTPRSLEWLERQTLPSKFHYYPWGIADHDGSAEFRIPKNPAHVSHSLMVTRGTSEKAVTVQVRTISSIMEQLGHTSIDLLKMDIEGSEYAVLTNILQSPLRPGLLLVEFHHRFPSIGATMTKQAVSELRKAGYKLYAISPSGEELCFCT